MSENVLVNRRHLESLSARERDRVWRALYERHFCQVYRIVGGLGCPRDDIDDVVQGVFMIAYRQIAQLENERVAGAWLRGIAVKVVADQRRFRRVRQLKHWILRSTVEAESQRPETPEALAGSLQTQRDVLAVLGQMKPKLRDVVVLVDLEQCSHEEAAGLLQIPIGTLRSRLQTARKDFARLWRRQAGGAR